MSTNGARFLALRDARNWSDEMVVGETLELFAVVAMVLISIVIMLLIQRATGGVDEEE